MPEVFGSATGKENQGLFVFSVLMQKWLVTHQLGTARPSLPAPK
jgi:hypothetical protein